MKNQTHIIIWFDDGAVFTVTNDRGEIIYLTKDEAESDFEVIYPPVPEILDTITDNKRVAVDAELFKRWYGVEL